MPGAGKVEAKVTHKFKALPDEVYEAWLEPEIIRSWMSLDVPGKGIGEIVTVETEPREGGAFLFVDRRMGVEARHRGTYRSLHRPHKIVFTWITGEDEEADPPEVTIIILPHPDGGTAVTLTHEMDAKWSEYVGRTERGWGVMMSQVEALLG